MELIKSKIGPKFSVKHHSKAIYISRPLSDLISKFSSKKDFRYISKELEFDINTKSFNYTTSELEFDIDTKRYSK
ncbi:kinase-like domain-containing protein [Rhizophagus irregularis DAOM 181602=DAOM 197198]|nr:kinase-like domain-containing protein [Rhizophagus irregularis DAOM 181602=DAOM 197198]